MINQKLATTTITPKRQQPCHQEHGLGVLHTPMGTNQPSLHIRLLPNHCLIPEQKTEIHLVNNICSSLPSGESRGDKSGRRLKPVSFTATQIVWGRPTNIILPYTINVLKMIIETILLLHS